MPSYTSKRLALVLSSAIAAAALAPTALQTPATASAASTNLIAVEAFTPSGPPDAGILTLNPATGSYQVVAGSDSMPGFSWAPQGNILTFAHGAGYPQIWVARADGSAKRPLTSSRTSNFAPSFSPDGTHIVFVRSYSANGPGCQSGGRAVAAVSLITRIVERLSVCLPNYFETYLPPYYTSDGGHVIINPRSSAVGAADKLQTILANGASKTGHNTHTILGAPGNTAVEGILPAIHALIFQYSNLEYALLSENGGAPKKLPPRTEALSPNGQFAVVDGAGEGGFYLDNLASGSSAPFVDEGANPTLILIPFSPDQTQFASLGATEDAMEAICIQKLDGEGSPPLGGSVCWPLPIGWHLPSNPPGNVVQWGPQPLVSASATTVTPTPPVLTKVAQSNRTWREGRRLASFSRKRKAAPLGTTFSFSLNVPASVSLVFTQQASGRRFRKACLARARRNKKRRRCTRTVVAGTLRFSAHAGTNKVRFEGPISTHKKLGFGTYKLLVTATTPGELSTPRTLRFTIVSSWAR